jgi:hypothetical protein
MRWIVAMDSWAHRVPGAPIKGPQTPSERHHSIQERNQSREEKKLLGIRLLKYMVVK